MYVYFCMRTTTKIAIYYSVCMYVCVCMCIGKMFPSQLCGAVRVGDRLDGVGDKNLKSVPISEWIAQLHRNMNNRRWSSLTSVLRETCIHIT